LAATGTFLSNAWIRTASGVGSLIRTEITAQSASLIQAPRSEI
jgi:hypothetical protein